MGFGTPRELVGRRPDVWGLGAGCCADAERLCLYHAGFKAGWDACRPVDIVWVAGQLGLDPQSIRRYLCSGDFPLPAGRVARAPWWPQEQMEAFIVERKAGRTLREATRLVEQDGDDSWRDGRAPRDRTPRRKVRVAKRA